MKLKKAAAVFLTGALVLSTAACGGGDSGSSGSGGSSGGSADSGAELNKKAVYVIGSLGDKAINDSGEAGMNVLRERGWDVKTLEVGDETKADKWEDSLLDVIDEGYDYIVASSTYRDIVMKLAEEYPEDRFVVLDDTMEEEDIPDNVAYIFYAQNEGSYLVGQVAAGMTETDVISVNVGMDNPVIADFVTGFVHGAQDYNPDIKIVKATVGSWTEPAKMKELCLTQARDQNADVFYQVAGGSGTGLFEACKEQGTWAIGVDSDQYAYYKDSENPELADVILTSMLKNCGDSIITFFDAVENGEDVWGKLNHLGLKENSVGYVDNEFYQANVPQEVRDAVKEAEEKILSGEIDVKSYYDFADESEYQAYLDSVAP